MNAIDPERCFPSDLNPTPEITSRAIILVDDCLLVMHLPVKNLIFLPGGHVESGETLDQALLRELKEELPSYTFQLVAERGVIEHHWVEQNGPHIGMHHFFEVCADGLDSAVLPEAVEPPLEFKWIPIADLAESGLKPPSLIPHILRHAQGYTSFWSELDRESE